MSLRPYNNLPPRAYEHLLMTTAHPLMTCMHSTAQVWMYPSDDADSDTNMDYDSPPHYATMLCYAMLRRNVDLGT